MISLIRALVILPLKMAYDDIGLIELDYASCKKKYHLAD